MQEIRDRKEKLSTYFRCHSSGQFMKFFQGVAEFEFALFGTIQKNTEQCLSGAGAVDFLEIFFHIKQNKTSAKILLDVQKKFRLRSRDR